MGVSDERSEVAVRFKQPRIKALRSLSAPNPGRFQSIITHRGTKSSASSESCASSAFPARSMEQSKSDDSMDYKILTCLANNKIITNCDTWDPTDPKVCRQVLRNLQITTKITEFELKERIEELQLKVKFHTEHTEKIVVNKELLLDVFDYVQPDFVGDSQDEEISIDAPSLFFWKNRKKRKDLTLGSDTILHRSKRAFYSGSSKRTFISNESVDQQLARLLNKKAVVEDILTGPYSMECCIPKLKKCDLPKGQFLKAITCLKNDKELRQIFILLDDSEARDYIMYHMKSDCNK